jgi:hypothetical protein
VCRSSRRRRNLNPQSRKERSQLDSFRESARPTLPEVIDRLRVQHERLRGIIGGLSGEQLDRPSAGNPTRTVRYAILHGLHDEAGHIGEAYLLLKMQAREGT